ncbi:MAG: ABC transporter substrate-binding protein [Anaerolineaceae bacterium]|nr:ABC transporter substrate-binding protein [Anaerolineaceae bacterium]
MRSKSVINLFSVLMVAAIMLVACSPAATPVAPTDTVAPAAPAATDTAAPAMPAATDTAAPAMAAPTATTAPAAAFDWSTAKSIADGGGMDALVKAAQAEGNLTVITLPRSWCDYGDMMDNFTAKYGIKIQDVNPDGGSADEVQAIKDNMNNKGPQAPDVLDIGPAYGPLAAGTSPTGPNLLAPYKVATWDTITGSKEATGLYYVDYYGILAFEVNTDVVKDVPQSWSDLLKPEYKGQIGLAGDPRASNEAAQSVFAAAINNGGSLDNVQPGLDFMKKLNTAGNLLPLIADPGVIAKGETPISIHWNYLALADKQSDNGNPNISVVYPTGTAWGGYYYQAISAYAPHPAAARLWEEYLYSDDGQNTLIKGFCTPARMADMLSRNVVPAAAQAALPPASMLASATIPNPDQLNAARAAVKAQWDSVVGLNIVANK